MKSFPHLRSLLLVSTSVVTCLSGCTQSAAAIDAPDASASSGGDETDADPTDADAGAEGPDAGTDRVSMANLVLQSQVEPFRGDQPGLPGDFAVEQVQQALLEEGFDVGLDGWYGNETAGAYADYQAGLGYSGLDANGIPGPSSLASLAEGRFTVDSEIHVGAHTTFTGRTVNQRTHDMLVAAEATLNHSIVLSQGSYNAGGVGASAGTHDGGGAVDISVAALSTTQRWQTVKALRTVGFAAWLRSPSEGPWPYHIHAIAIADTDLAITARNQVADYYVGKNGLASHATDTTPADYKAPFTWWEKYQGQ